MFDIADQRFLTALLAASEAQLSADHPCVVALRKAAKSQNVHDMSKARQAVHDLEDDVKDLIMAETHRHMRMDLTAIIGGVPDLPDPDKLH